MHHSLSEIDIESELSYAYLHAVASKAGLECTVSGRHSDNRGVDAALKGWELPTGTYQTSATLDVQLKATVKPPSENDGYLSYSLSEIHRYDALRQTGLQVPRVLVVLFLPADRDDWLSISADELVMKRAAYWVSLVGAAASSNQTAQTVYLPQGQLFTPDEAQSILTRVARRETLNYVTP